VGKTISGVVLGFVPPHFLREIFIKMSEGKKEILLGDCLELMKDIPNGSIDMILADLPYGVTSCKWDAVIPFEPLWGEYERIIKKDGAIVLTSVQPFTSALVMSNPKLFKYTWVFKKSLPVGHGYAKFRPMSNHEDICVFGKGKTVYNPQFTPRYKPRVYTRKKASLSGSSSMTSHDGKTRVLNGKYPVTVQEFNTSVQKGKLHPTQKPIALFEYLIKTYTNEGELVLDNTAGSGTTAIACLNTNRQFIVMEKEQKYYDIILKRVGDFNKNFEPQTLFGNDM
jgi:site-specific DNA-methyltransferase (adenine-specific)